MDKKEIVNKLKKHFIRPKEGWKAYESAKNIICPIYEPLEPREYEARIRVISEYLKI